MKTWKYRISGRNVSKEVSITAKNEYEADMKAEAYLTGEYWKYQIIPKGKK